MEGISVKVDRQATSLIDISFWSNLAIVLLLAVANFVNFTQAATAKGPLFTFAAPELILIASAALALWLAYNCAGLLAAKARLSKVRVALDENGVSGYALENPTLPQTGEPFSVSYESIRYVGVIDVPITKKHSAASLKVATDERGYVVPAPQNLQELVRRIADRMPAES